MSEPFTTRQIRIANIGVLSRIRRKMDGLDELVDDIRKNGLINPITVMDCGEGKYTLIAGQRRLHAMMRMNEHTIRATVLGPIDAQKALELEYSENEQRQAFTVSERLSFAEKLKVIEQEKARERMSSFARAGRPDGIQGVGNCPYPDERGSTRDLVADKAGFSSEKQYRRAMAVAEKRPDLLEKIDSGETSIHAAYLAATNAPAQPNVPAEQYEQHADIMDADDLGDIKPILAPPDYPTYIAAHATAHGVLVDELQGIIDTLRAENRELRRRLGLSETEPVIITEENEEENHHG